MCYNKRCGAKLRYAAVFVLGGQIQYGIINAAKQSSATLPYLSLADKYNTVFYKRCGAKLRYAVVFVLGGQIQYGVL